MITVLRDDSHKRAYESDGIVMPHSEVRLRIGLETSCPAVSGARPVRWLFKAPTV